MTALVGALRRAGSSDETVLATTLAPQAQRGGQSHPRSHLSWRQHGGVRLLSSDADATLVLATAGAGKGST